MNVCTATRQTRELGQSKTFYITEEKLNSLIKVRFQVKT